MPNIYNVVIQLLAAMLILTASAHSGESQNANGELLMTAKAAVREVATYRFLNNSGPTSILSSISCVPITVQKKPVRGISFKDVVLEVVVEEKPATGASIYVYRVGDHGKPGYIVDLPFWIRGSLSGIEIAKEALRIELTVPSDIVSDAGAASRIAIGFSLVDDRWIVGYLLPVWTGGSDTPPSSK